MSPVQILIADDHDAIRRSLRALVQSRPGWRVCGEAADGVDAVEKARQLRPDIVLLDVTMPRMDGIEAARLIRREVASEVILVSQNEPAVVSRQAKQAGARGWVAKSRVAQDLIPAIEGIVKRRGRETPQESPGQRPDVIASGPEWAMIGGEMGERMRTLDWSRTPLGAIENWPQSLKTSVSICLASRFPIVMYWGPEYVVLYNHAYSAILGSKHPWALGQRCCDCWAEIWGTIGPMLDQVVSSAQATWSDDLLLMLQRHGYSEECYFSFSFSPIRIETGEVGGVFTAVMETTEKVIGERRLRTLRDLAARAVDANTEPEAWRISLETIGQNRHDIPFAVLVQVTGAGPVRIVGAAGIEETHELCTELGTPDTPPFKLVSSAAKSKEVVEVSLREFAGQLPHGSWQSAPASALLLPIGESGTERGTGVLLAGVSPHKQLDESYRTFFQLLARQIANSVADARAHDAERRRAEALAELDRAKTAFFSSVSHEFRTPLTLMLGPLEDALASAKLDAEERERLQVAHRNSLRLLKLVNALLDFSRIEAGRVRASYQPTDLCQLTAELASGFRSAIERAGLKLIVNCADFEEPVYVDRQMWEKIVFNLLSNAFKFTFEGEIEVALRNVDRTAELSVRDTGTGIPQNELPHLFERFFRVSGARGRTFEGSGIGLSLVEELVKLHGGTVRVESDSNRGSTFTVNIPFGKEHLPGELIEGERTELSTKVTGEAYVQEALNWLDDPENISPDSPLTTVFPARGLKTGIPQPMEQRPRVLLADDNADMRGYVRRLLREEYEVVAVGDGEAALRKARERRPDLILTDVMMPRLDGFGLLKAVRADDTLSNVPVILLSARAGEESRIEGLQHGADDYLVKPFSARELLARVSSQLLMARMRRQSAELEHKLRLDSELLAAIVASSEDAIVSKNLDGVITSWNKGAEQIFGYAAKEAIGQHITLIIPSDRREEETEIIAKLRRGEKIEHFETVRVRKGGERLDISVTISPIRDATGRVVGASKVARDITQRKRAEAEVRQAEQRYRDLAETLELEVKARTMELENRNAEVLVQAELLRRFSHRLLTAQDEERRRIARELHDSAGQTLTVLGISLAQLIQKAGRKSPELAIDAEKIQDTVKQLHREIRTTSYLLHPPLLDETGLASALSWYVQGLAERSELEITLDVAEDFGRLPRDMELAIFRLVQECLTNIHRHSASNLARIQIACDNAAVHVNVEDHGRGMAPDKLAEIQSGGSGVGIRGMRERLRPFDGKLEIESDRTGTRISVAIPFTRAPRERREDGIEPLQAAV